MLRSVNTVVVIAPLVAHRLKAPTQHGDLKLMQPVEAVLVTFFADSAYALNHKLCFAPPLVGTHASIVPWCKI